jgi:WD40 repeat protein
VCASPQLPLYLAGGDSVVQCWQFGQTIQGQGLHDHLRAQYKLPAGGQVANIRISPECEQFCSIDQAGYLCLWRFQSGADMPLPFSRLQCHTRRGADLCFVNSSVVLATVGLSHGGDSGSSLCLWDVLLPPAQAQVARCATHSEGGRCVLHCPSEMCLVSGGDRGEMAIFDLRQRRLREKWTAHTMAIQALVLAEDSWCFSTSADADIKLWSLDAPCASSMDCEDRTCAEGQPRGSWAHAHEPHSILAPLVGTKLGRCGVTSLTLLPGAWPSARGVNAYSAGLISGGADGKVKMWRW